MVRSVLRMLGQVLRRLATRVLLIASLALVALAASVFVGPVVPDWLVERLGVDSLDTILNILASSMLTVTTFSLSILTGAIQFASSSVTPRSRLVLRDDALTNMVLANFVGAFVFALLGIILRATPFMGEAESALLFLLTVAVIAVVIVSILRWIDHLARLGAMDETVAVFETTALRVMQGFNARPALGGHVVSREDIDAQSDHPALTAAASGYVEQIFEDALQDAARDAGVDLYVAVRPGDYVVPGMPLAWMVGGAPTGGQADSLRGGFRITTNRLFEQDPRLCVIVLTEVASRALSPGINDPQTAIDVVHRLSAILLHCAPDLSRGPDEITNDRLYMAPTDPDAFFRATFDVIARDGQDKAEIGGAVDAALDRLEGFGNDRVRAAARACRARLQDRPRG
ncbi:DUF2254 domain-containing protein [Marinibacterium sp. SX1]|uniref:DUF2254 domain-containing protein n=1 Tax=Marinibacterium sp. SX1 TaxID=3388424 RepID=UPI003D171BE8